MSRSLLLLALAATLVGAAAPAPDVRIDDRDIYPESLSADRAGRLYIGSIKGIVYRTTPNGDVAERWVTPSAENGILSLLGVLVDEPSRTLWLCSAPMPLRKPPAVGISSVVALDLESGRFKARYPFPAPDSSCNDIAVGPDRTLYATDTPNGRILMLSPGSHNLVIYAEDRQLKGIDGIAFARDGALYVNNVQKQQMLRVDRNPDGSFKAFTQLTLSEPVSGPDGLRPIGGNRFLQAEGGSGRITLVTITGDRAQIDVLRSGLDSSPGVTPARGRAYAVEGKIGYLFDPKLKGRDPNPFLVRAVPLEAR